MHGPTAPPLERLTCHDPQHHRFHPRPLACGLRRNGRPDRSAGHRSEEHTSELQSLMRISYAVFCLKKKKQTNKQITKTTKQTCNIPNRKTHNAEHEMQVKTN